MKEETHITKYTCSKCGVVVLLEGEEELSEDWYSLSVNLQGDIETEYYDLCPKCAHIYYGFDYDFQHVVYEWIHEND